MNDIKKSQRHECMRNEKHLLLFCINLITLISLSIISEMRRFWFTSVCIVCFTFMSVRTYVSKRDVHMIEMLTIMISCWMWNTWIMTSFRDREGSKGVQPPSWDWNLYGNKFGLVQKIQNVWEKIPDPLLRSRTTTPFDFYLRPCPERYKISW